jgi:hypothetical protein
MFRGFITEPRIIVVRGLALVRAFRLGNKQEQQGHASVREALTNFSSGVGKAVPTTEYLDTRGETNVRIIQDDERKFLQHITVRERLDG